MTVEDFEVTATIGDGLVSTVYQARPKAAINGRIYESVLLKRLKCVKPENHEDFLAQAEQLTFFSLPSNFSMVHILGHFVRNDENYLVMDDSGDAKTLRQVVDDRTRNADPNDTDEYLPVLHAKEITYLSHQMISLLATVHSQIPPIRHGYIRPETIFQFSDPTISTAQFKLGDFGNSIANNDVNALLSSGASMSVFLYMAPELVTKIGHSGTPSTESSVALTTASDMWSLGATILNLSLGHDVSNIWSSESAKNKFEDGTWSFDEDILGKLDDIQTELWTQQSGLSQLTMRTCLRCCPEDRPAAADVMLMPTYFEALQERHKDVHEENKALKDMIEALEMRLREATASVPPPTPADEESVMPPPTPMS